MCSLRGHDLKAWRKVEDKLTEFCEQILNQRTVTSAVSVCSGLG